MKFSRWNFESLWISKLNSVTVMDTGDVIVTVTLTTLNHQRFDFVGPRSTKIEEFRQWALRQTKNQDYACSKQTKKNKRVS